MKTFICIVLNLFIALVFLLVAHFFPLFIDFILLFPYIFIIDKVDSILLRKDEKSDD